jgi:hypothetical protein
MKPGRRKECQSGIEPAQRREPTVEHGNVIKDVQYCSRRLYGEGGNWEQCFLIGARAEDGAESPGCSIRKYRNDHSISLSHGRLRADLPNIEIPAEGRIWRQRKGTLTYPT